MANVLNNLAADIYKAADVVGRELVGFIPSATINGDATTRYLLSLRYRLHLHRQKAIQLYIANFRERVQCLPVSFE